MRRVVKRTSKLWVVSLRKTTLNEFLFQHIQPILAIFCLPGTHTSFCLRIFYMECLSGASSKDCSLGL